MSIEWTEQLFLYHTPKCCIFAMEILVISAAVNEVAAHLSRNVCHFSVITWCTGQLCTWSGLTRNVASLAVSVRHGIRLFAVTEW